MKKTAKKRTTKRWKPGTLRAEAPIVDGWDDIEPMVDALLERRLAQQMTILRLFIREELADHAREMRGILSIKVALAKSGQPRAKKRTR